MCYLWSVGGGRGRDGCERLSQAQLAATQNYPFPASLCWQRADFTWVLTLHLDSSPGGDNPQIKSDS